MATPTINAGACRSPADFDFIDSGFEVDIPELEDNDMIIACCWCAPGSPPFMSYVDGNPLADFYETGFEVGPELAIAVVGYGVPPDGSLAAGIRSGLHNLNAKSTRIRIASGGPTPVGFPSIIVFSGATTGALVDAPYFEVNIDDGPFIGTNVSVNWSSGLAAVAVDAVWIEWLLYFATTQLDDDGPGGADPYWTNDYTQWPADGTVAHLQADPPSQFPDALALAGSASTSPGGSWDVVTTGALTPPVVDVGLIGTPWLFQVWDDPGYQPPAPQAPVVIPQIAIDPSMVADPTLALELEPIDTSSVDVPLKQWIGPGPRRT